MKEQELLGKGYFPKELPPCFFTELLANNIASITLDLNAKEAAAKTAFENKANSIVGLTTAQKAEEQIRLRQVFKNRLYYSECGHFSIPKPGIARNLIKIPNPLHQSKLSATIAANYTDISALYVKSSFSTAKPEQEIDIGEGKRSVKHNTFGFFKELCIINSFKYSIQLKADIASFYPSIYTHTVPWVTFGGKDKYKRNRDLHHADTTKINTIYGDDIDDNLMWCQNQQTMGIPVGPDTSFIIAEIIACHVDELLEKKLKNKRINFLAYRYYDDYAMYFDSELDAQVGLAELKSILHDFELRINDGKTKISKTSSELETEWALTLKSFYFRPTEEDQKEDLWNYFSRAFRYASLYPNDGVLKLAINKFKFVRISKENWSFFESLIYRAGFEESGALQNIAKLLISYKSLVNKKKLRIFCSELIMRNVENRNDYELTWALWLLNEFNLQPTKEILTKVLRSQSTTACIIALDLLSQNKKIINFDYSIIHGTVTTESLNTKNWLLSYEAIYNGWIPGLPNAVVSDHFYFNILQGKKVHFYDSSRKLDPIKTERSYLKQIEAKIIQIQDYHSKNKLSETDMPGIQGLFNDLKVGSLTKAKDRIVIFKKLTDSLKIVKSLVEKADEMLLKLKEFDKKRPYFVMGKRSQELENLISKEIDAEVKENHDLLFDPKYD